MFNTKVDIPNEIALKILSYVEQSELLKFSLVSRAWHKNCFDKSLWTTIISTDSYLNHNPELLIRLITRFADTLNELVIVVKDETVFTRDHVLPFASSLLKLSSFTLQSSMVTDYEVMSQILSSCGATLVNLKLSTDLALDKNIFKLISNFCPALIDWTVSCQNLDLNNLTYVLDKCIQLRGFHGFSDEVMEDLDYSPFAQSLYRVSRRLHALSLDFGDWLTDDYLLLIIHGASSPIPKDARTGFSAVPPFTLRKLELGGSQITSQSIKEFAIAHLLPELDSLNIILCYNVFDDGLVPLLRILPKLTSIECQDCYHLTNATLNVLAESDCHMNLTRVDFRNAEISSQDFIKFLECCPKLATITKIMTADEFYGIKIQNEDIKMKYPPNGAHTQLRAITMFDTTRLPHEFKVQILRFLNQSELPKLSLISKSWYDACFDSSLWATIDTGDFLNNLQYTGYQVGKIILRFARNITRLKFSTFYHPVIEDYEVELFASSLEKLQTLVITNEVATKYNVMLTLLSSAGATLTELHLSAAVRISPDILRLIAKFCPKLKIIYINCCDMTLNGLADLHDKCTQLQTSTLAGIQPIGLHDNYYPFMEALYRISRKFGSISIDHLDWFTNDYIRILMHGTRLAIPKNEITGYSDVPSFAILQHLELVSVKIDSAALVELAYLLPELTSLNLSGCNSICDNGLVALMPTLPQN
ncbi:hypothetical protein V1512DRAFT_253033 [Lipomyces arxii]|uniref:uncharacterized protein n=1 Tax=Lipomyces arxii TaxID=56418 RepID=UPI0034CE3B33